ncbi:MAG: hypothetical protein SO101_02595 [Lachnospiraceae bacterium]|nr:hypothetical protein [Lachnospiraceae bacterium]
MKFRKLTAAALTCMMCIALPMTSLAANTTEFTFVDKNEPTYTVTIPSTLELEKDGSELNITASDVAYLDGKKISVTIAGTDYYRNQMVLEGETSSGPRTSIRYQIIKGDEVIETTGGKDQVNGVELASFTENGTASLIVKPVITSTTQKDVLYKGSITYGIALTDTADPEE